MSDINPFVLETSQYKRKLSFLRTYVEDISTAISISESVPIEEARSFVKKELAPGGMFEFKDPEITYTDREENGDRHEKRGTMLQYLLESIQNEEIIAATFTTYLSPKVMPSLLVEYIDENVAIRSKAKKAMFAAEMAGDKAEQAFKDCEQANAKISNNSISGSHVTSSTPLYNKSAHSALTSNCRITSGYGNANNEKMLSGNRHYHNPEIVLNNIISIINRTDMDSIQYVMDKYKLEYPTAEYAFEVCTGNRGSGQYWGGAAAKAKIYDLLSKLTPLQLAAFVYVGDMYRLSKLNDEVFRNFITDLSARVTYDESFEKPKAFIKAHREEFIPLACQLWPDLMKGVDFKKLSDDNPAHHKTLIALAGTVKNISDTMIKYGDLIKAFFVTDNVPPSLAFFPNSIRHAALTSDTDSTIFTVQDWVQWKTGRVSVDSETNAVAATMIWLAAEAIVHILAKMSANLGVVQERLYMIAMKNEFKFDVFIPTQVGKHYYAYIGCQEGNLYIDYKMEIKGVHLKSSNVVALVMDQAVAMMREIMDTAAKGGKISIYEMVNRVANIESEIERSMLAGESTYFRTGQIKPPDTYTKPKDQSPYAHHTFWNECFATKYGFMVEPPYGIYKLAVKLRNKRAILAWIETIKDPAMKQRVTDWNEATKKNSINTILLPQQIVSTAGIPEELMSIIDIRRAKIDNTMVFYLILETLGWYCINDKLTELVSDYYSGDLSSVDIEAV